MKQVTVHLRSTSVYSQGKPYKVEKLNKGKESNDDYEQRTWRERCHTVSPDDDRIIITNQQFKECLDNAAQYVGMKIVGKQNSTYTKNFKAGIMIPEGIVLPDKKSTVQSEARFVPGNGKPGGGRVWKNFPIITKWEGKLGVIILDEIITEEIFTTHLQEAGRFVGIGRDRPQGGGSYGRFAVDKVEWPK